METQSKKEKVDAKNSVAIMEEQLSPLELDLRQDLEDEEQKIEEVILIEETDKMITIGVGLPEKRRVNLIHVLK